MANNNEKLQKLANEFFAEAIKAVVGGNYSPEFKSEIGGTHIGISLNGLDTDVCEVTLRPDGVLRIALSSSFSPLDDEQSMKLWREVREKLLEKRVTAYREREREDLELE